MNSFGSFTVAERFITVLLVWTPWRIYLGWTSIYQLIPFHLLHYRVSWFHHSASSCSHQGGICWAHHKKVEGQPHLITWWLLCAIHGSAGLPWELPPASMHGSSMGASGFQVQLKCTLHHKQIAELRYILIWAKPKEFLFCFQMVYQIKACSNR